MNALYILQSEKTGRYYIGSTTDFNNRIIKHNAGLVLSTKAYKPWKVVFMQDYAVYSDARKAELKIKRYKRRDYIEKIVQSGQMIL